jgi:hypothetical protein
VVIITNPLKTLRVTASGTGSDTSTDTAVDSEIAIAT